MGLLKLNDDIILMIFGQIGLPEVVDFLKTNRRTHALGHKLLKEHQDLTKNYTAVSISPALTIGPDSGFSYICEHPAELLVDIRHRPLIASYIKSISMGALTTLNPADARALYDRADAKLRHHQIFQHFKDEEEDYSPLFTYNVGVPFSQEDVDRSNAHRWYGLSKGTSRGGLKATMFLLLSQLKGLRFFNCPSFDFAVRSLVYNYRTKCPTTNRVSKSRQWLAALNFHELDFRYDSDQRLDVVPSRRLVSGAPGCLAVRLGVSQDPHNYDAMEWLGAALKTGTGPRVLGFEVTARFMGYILEYALKGDQNLIRFRRTTAFPDELSESSWRREEFDTVRRRHGKLGVHSQETMEEVFERLACDSNGKMHRNHRVAELHGSDPDIQELRVIKRDDISWGECEYDMWKRRPERPWWDL